MTKYIVQDDQFNGYISFVYDAHNMLVEWLVNSWDIQPKQTEEWIMALGMCLTATYLVQYCRENGKKCHRAKIDLTFERFYLMYNVGRDRHKAEPRWNRMSELQRYRIILNLRSYNRYCLRNPKYTKMSPNAYLGGHYNNNWDKLEDFK